MNARFNTRFARFALACTLSTGLLASCGGGGGDSGAVPAATTCALEDQKTWLGGYMNDEYLWYATKPNPNPASFASVDGYFGALLTPGVAGNADLPADRWSYTESTATYSQFFEEGRTLGYGLAVAGLEVQGQPGQPLRVRYIEPASPAATAGIVRGDTIVSINGEPAPNYIARDDFSVLTPVQAGDTLQLVVRNAQAVDRNVSLVASVFDLTPVSSARIVQSPAGTQIGYLVLKDFISQANAPLEAAFADFKAKGVREVVLDLRYNGGGLVSVARTLGSYVAGAPVANQTFALLLHNDKRQSRNSVFRFADPAQLPSAMGATRVFVLSGQRTCSASELVVNGLRPFVNVVQVGDATCGKPVGFNPVDSCGTTFSAVNFESVNADGEGRYWNGLEPTCPVADDFDHALGDGNEALLAAARGYVDTGACPVASTRERPMAARGAWKRVNEGERPRMIGR